jgi:hypothetical protein
VQVLAEVVVLVVAVVDVVGFCFPIEKVTIPVLI